MAKDPAFLFYPGDWLGGTMRFSRHHKGAYMDLLMAQFNGGRMTIEDIKDVLGSDFESMWESKLKAKFERDEKGLFYNKRLDFEQQKRKNFSNSRRKNLSYKEDHMDSHMENKNENKDKIIDLPKTKEERKKEFSEKCKSDLPSNDPKSVEDFISYWNESNEKGLKLRFEMQKVFDIKRRFTTWMKNQKDWDKGSGEKKIQTENKNLTWP